MVYMSNNGLPKPASLMGPAFAVYFVLSTGIRYRMRACHTTVIIGGSGIFTGCDFYHIMDDNDYHYESRGRAP